MNLTLEEIALGVEKTIKIKKDISCNSCKGSGARGKGHTTCSMCKGAGEIKQASSTMFGQFVNIQTCPNCGGDGQIIKEKCTSCYGRGAVKGEATVKVNIPAGVSSGNYLTLENQGNAGNNGGAAGDLIIQIIEKKHHLFSRDGNDIVYTLNLSYPEISLGTKKVVPTIDGTKENLTINPGTPIGHEIILHGKGLGILHQRRRGSMRIKLSVTVPKKLSEREKQLLRELDTFSSKHSQKQASFSEKMRDIFS